MPLRGARRIIGNNLAKITTSATAISGKFESFVRYVAAIVKPVDASSKKLGAFVRNHCSRHTNSAPKQTGDRTSLFIA